MLIELAGNGPNAAARDHARAELFRLAAAMDRINANAIATTKTFCEE
jgi:hypothetical protein